MYTHYDAVLVLFHDPTIQEHPVEYDQHVTLDAVPVNFKKFQTDTVSSRSFVKSSFAQPCLQILFGIGSV